MSDKRNAAMDEYWNGAGGQNWMSHRNHLEEGLKNFAQRVISAAAPASNEHILDVGFGCGETSIELAQLVGSNGRVHGVDISAPMTKEAQLKAEAKGLANLSFESGDAQTMSLPKAEYDLAFSRFGVMFFDDFVGAFRNILTSLKPDGRLVFMCWAKRSENNWLALPLKIAAKHLTLPKPPEGPEAPGPFALSNEERVSGILGEAGFSDINIEVFRTQVVLGADLDEALSFLMELSPLGGLIKQAEADGHSTTALIAELSEHLEAHEGEAGIALDGAALAVSAIKN